MPDEISGTHFGPTLTAFILYQYYGCHVTQPLIAKQLQELGIEISTGQISNIIINNKERFHTEKDQILATGLKISGHINVDDTGARHNGANGYCIHIGNQLFAWLKSTKTKSRTNFLKLLQGQHNDLIINDAALEYMNQQSLPRYQLIKFSNRVFTTERKWRSFLFQDGIRKKHPNHFTHAMVFRLCEKCHEINIVKDSWFVCHFCRSELPRDWNVSRRCKANP